MKICYVERKFSTKSEALIQIADEIMTDYAGQGYDLSLRQLYYQFVARNHIENSEKSYKNLGSLISDARLAGYLDWGIIKDRGRAVVANSHWESPNQILSVCARSFRLDLWEDQDAHVLVMVEKQALEGVLVPVCTEMDVRFVANKGYSSSTTLHDIGLDLTERMEEGKECFVLYLGDHDPSGIDMTRDVRERLELFSGGTVECRRLALNMDQITRYRMPENPTKITDSRAMTYIREFGYRSWELDAMEPSALANLVRDEILSLRNEDRFHASLSRQQAMKDDLARMSREYQYQGPDDEDTDD